jgi:hypothetical protein
MKLRLVPAARGALWVRQGFAVFFKHPLGFAGLFATFLFALFLSMLLPWIGPLLLLAILPLISLGFMIGTRTALAGRFPLPRVFFEPLRRGRARQVALLQLGVLYALATALIIWFSDVVDAGALDRLMQTLSNSKTTPEAMQQALADPRLQTGLVLRFGLAGLLSVPFWHAPALVHWGAQSAPKSLFFSLMACWRNRGAFAVYALTWTAAILLFAVGANLLFALLGQVQIMAVAAMPASLIISTVFYASLYFTFADCFEMNAADSELPSPLNEETTR